MKPKLRNEDGRENLLQGGRFSLRHSTRDYDTWHCQDRFPKIASPARMVKSSDRQESSMRLALLFGMFIEGKSLSEYTPDTGPSQDDRETRMINVTMPEGVMGQLVFTCSFSMTPSAGDFI